MMVTLHLGDCIDIMTGLKSESVDTVITDPPYGLKFMGKDWDHGVPGIQYWREALRVAKPGAMLLAFGGTRTHHRLMVAIEDAGWVIRDCLMWLYGSGFPKSHNISKAIDKAAGAEREVIGPSIHHSPGRTSDGTRGSMNQLYRGNGDGKYITAPATDAAKLWDGYGTALKPAWEPIILAMKPLDGTFANNALEHGVAGLWVDGGRIAHNEECKPMKAQKNGNLVYAQSGRYRETLELKPNGRFPANLILDEEAGAMLDRQSGESTSRQGEPRTGQNGNGWGMTATGAEYNDTGGASRFFQRCDFTEEDTWQFANFAAESSSQQNGLDVFAHALAAIEAGQEGRLSRDSIQLFTSAIRSESSKNGARNTTTIQNTGERCLQELKHTLTEQLNSNRVDVAEIQKLTSTIQIMQNLMSISGFAESVTLPNTPSSMEVGEKDSRPLRFKYCAKAPKKERWFYCSICQDAFHTSKRKEHNHGKTEKEQRKHIYQHPTVKPLSLMRYLVRLTKIPTGGVVLDPFMGSGKTGEACILENRSFIGIEIEQPSYTIAKRCIESAQSNAQQLELIIPKEEL